MGEEKIDPTLFLMEELPSNSCVLDEIVDEETSIILPEEIDDIDSAETSFSSNHIDESPPSSGFNVVPAFSSFDVKPALTSRSIIVTPAPSSTDTHQSSATFPLSPTQSVMSSTTSPSGMSSHMSPPV